MLLLSTVLIFSAANCPAQDAPLAGAVPAVSDLHFFEDASARFAFAGYRERWNDRAIPTPPLPVAYAFQPEVGPVRAKLVDAGAGAEADFERLATFGLDLTGLVVVVEVPAGKVRAEGNAPGGHAAQLDEWMAVSAIADRAKAVGAAAVVVATDADWFVAPDTSLIPPRLALPVAPMRRTDLAAIQSRLRAKRVRGPDGKTVTLRAGPGPIEASVRVAPLDESGGD